MDSNLNVLETKVLEAVELIKELRTENQRLTIATVNWKARLWRWKPVWADSKKRRQD